MLSLPQTRVQRFENEILPFTRFISATGIQSLADATDTFLDGFRTLGVGELYARQYERQSQLKKLAELATHSKAQFKKYNDLGITRIVEANSKLNGVAKEMSKTISAKDLKGVEGELKKQIEEFKLQCVDMEIKGRDVEKLFKGIDEVFKGFQKGGINGIVELTSKKMKDLVEMRKGSDRGAVDNFPAWKVAAIVVALGVWVLAFIHCGIFRCSIRTGLAYAVVFAIAAAVSQFC